MTAAGDENLVKALVHHANVILYSDTPENASRERDLDDVKRALRLAERILDGSASGDDRASVREVVHEQVRGLYGL